MTTPDAAAAVEHADPLVRDLTDAHKGMTIEVLEPGRPPVTGELAFSERDIPMGVMNIALRDLEVESDFLTHLVVPLDTPYRALTGEAEPPIRPVDFEKIRELTTVCDRLRIAKGEIKDLEDRKKALSNQLAEDFAANGLRIMNVDGRVSYVHTPTYAQYNERPDNEGGRYTDEDLIPVLEAMGRGDLIKPRSIHRQTLASFLREFRDSKTPVPEAVAKIVKLAGDPEIRVRA